VRFSGSLSISNLVRALHCSDLGNYSARHHGE
jgi:hypothetical protein